MFNITIPLEVPSDLLLTLNETEKELKEHMQLAVAMMLFFQKKITIGKAVKLSGLTRYEFEKALANNKIPISDISLEDVVEDVEKLEIL